MQDLGQSVIAEYYGFTGYCIPVMGGQRPADMIFRMESLQLRG